MKKLLMISAAGEMAMGLILLIHPPIAVRLLFGTEIAGAGLVISRATGFALMGLGIACIPHRDCGNTNAVTGMIVYSAAVALYLAFLGMEGVWVGKLLWPAVAAHALLAALLAHAWLRHRQAGDSTISDTKRSPR